VGAGPSLSRKGRGEEQATLSSPLPLREREGPARPFGEWEGEGRRRHAPTPGATERARSLRREQTDAEARLWSILRAGQLAAKFRRQSPIEPYIADFVCPAARLIVEADGGQHTPEADAARTLYLGANGYRLLRFWNNDILTNIDGVAAIIREALACPLPPTREERVGPSLSRKGRGVRAARC